MGTSSLNGWRTVHVKDLQDQVNSGLLDLDILGEAVVLEKYVASVVPGVCFCSGACCFPLLMGLDGALLRLNFVAVAMFPCWGALDGACEVVVGWP